MKNDILIGLSSDKRDLKVAKGAAVKEAMSLPEAFPSLAEQKAAYIQSYDEFVQSIPAPNVRNKVNEMECQLKTDAFATNNIGVLLVTCDPEKQVDSYIARVSADRQNWIENFNKATRIVLTNVPTGVTLFVQVQAKNSAGRSAWSKIVETRLPTENEPIVKTTNFSIENI